jgi:hypothetical protein
MPATRAHVSRREGSDDSDETRRDAAYAEVGIHHGVDVALEEAVSGELLEGGAVGEGVHVHPGHAGLHGAKDGQLRREDRVVDHLLVLGEAAVGRVGAGDVGAVALVLTAHVEQHEVAIGQLLVVGRACAQREREDPAIIRVSGVYERHTTEHAREKNGDGGVPAWP